MLRSSRPAKGPSEEVGADGKADASGRRAVERLDAWPEAPTPELPPGRAGPARIVVAEGEATGHAHALQAADGGLAFRRPGAGASVLEIGHALVGSGARLVHDEHGHIELGPGVWRLRRQRRYDPVRHARPALD